MSRLHRNVPKHLLALFAIPLCGVLCLSGCGADTYQQRLNATADYFGYLERVNNALESNGWGDHVGMTLRVPKGFQPITGPVADTDAEEMTDVSDAAVDPRQPTFMELPLPGLEGAWDAELLVAGLEEPRLGYLYALTNYSMWTERAHDIAVDPLSFHEDVAHCIGVAAGESGLLLADPRWEDERFPLAADGYVPRKLVTSIRLEADVDGVPTEFLLFLFEAKDIRAALVFVIPKALEDPRTLQTAITHCLEMWEVSPATPTKGGAAAKNAPKF
jgi:hypothetical protein